MATYKSIMADILSTTMRIQEQFPELTKFMPEMPVAHPVNSDQEITIKSLKEYRDSLKKLLENYSTQHEAEPLPEKNNLT
ncbi:MAG TPA: hypothetical protein PLU11_13155 [Chitinophagaceae bacterium]|nr:hypothetical protein [Chitinophagaceae bacterium]HPH32651.1 hypothetical protein [Chitinophagaceae bacterium]HPN60126.1 hypothetical protein [Chitinophagaceae bacterium]